MKSEKSFFVLIMAVVSALLLTTSCNSELEVIEESDPEQVRIIPYSVSVGSNVSTRATLNNMGRYVFEDGDKLYVWGDKISGELNLTSTGNNGYTASFSGYLTWTGEGEKPADDYPLNAVIVSSNSQIFGTLYDFIVRGCEPNFNIVQIASFNLDEIVQKFGYFRSTSDFGSQSFDFYEQQHSAYVYFSITLEDGTTAGSDIEVSISNDGSEVRTGTVTVRKTEGSIKANFITAFPALNQEYILSNASVKLGDRDTIGFGGTLANDYFYSVNKTYTRYNITTTATLPPYPPIYEGGQKSESTSGKAAGYNITLQEMLTAMGANMFSNWMTGCTCTDGNNVTLEKISDTPYDCRFTVNGEGVTSFTVTTSLGDVPFSFNVSKMMPTE